MRFCTIVLYLVFLLASCNSIGQVKQIELVDYSLPRSEQRFISSEVNGIDYKLYISYPQSYKDSVGKKYPVLYLLDADYSFAIAKNIVDHLSERNHIREMIIVGIAYTGPNKYREHRTRDYTPTRSEEPAVSFQAIQNRYSGGGSQFSSFLETELIPYVDENFRTTDFRAITGHSYGGLFSSWILLTKPQLFRGYIIVSPSLWYDDHLLFRAEEKLSTYRGDAIKSYFSVGDREINNTWNMPKDLKDFINILQAKGLDYLELKTDLGDNQTHNSIFPSALSNGLRFVFDGI
jgi:predicted alpha/beta superfamily hydrolase